MLRRRRGVFRQVDPLGAPSEATAACPAPDLAPGAAADLDRPSEMHLRVWRSGLRAGLFVLAAFFACLLICLLAIIFVLWIRTAPVAMLTPLQARPSGPGGVATQEGPSTSTECFLWRRSRAQCEPRQTLGCCRANFIKRHSTLPASLPTSSGARVSPPFRAVEFSNCAPNLAATGPRVHNPEIAHRLLDELT